MSSLRLRALAALSAAALVVGGCGQKSGGEATPPAGGGGGTTSTTADTAKPAAAPVNIDYASLDKGPRAAASKVDVALAATGKILFTSKTCVTCHKFDVKLIGPPLGPVAKQRTAKWIVAQMTHPDLMTANDPVAKQLLAEYKVQMIVPGGVTEDEAKALVEYIKSGGK